MREMDFIEVLPFLLSRSPSESMSFSVDLNSYKSVFNLSSWVPASVIEAQLEALLRLSSQYSVPLSELSQDAGLEAISLPMLMDAVSCSQVLVSETTDRGVEVSLRSEWPLEQKQEMTPVRSALWGSDKKPTRHFESWSERVKMRPVRLTEFFPEESLAKDLKTELESEIATRRGEDLYVLRTDGVERVYKNNSQYYLQKKSSRKAHLDRVQRLQSYNDDFYTPKSRCQRVQEPQILSYPPRRQFQRKQSSSSCATEADGDRSHIECLELKFARVSLQDITNVSLAGRPLRLSHNGGN